MACKEKITEMKKMSKEELFNYLWSEALMKKGGILWLINLCVYLIQKDKESEVNNGQEKQR